MLCARRHKYAPGHPSLGPYSADAEEELGVEQRQLHDLRAGGGNAIEFSRRERGRKRVGVRPQGRVG